MKYLKNKILKYIERNNKVLLDKINDIHKNNEVEKKLNKNIQLELEDKIYSIDGKIDNIIKEKIEEANIKYKKEIIDDINDILNIEFNKINKEVELNIKKFNKKLTMLEKNMKDIKKPTNITTIKKNTNKMI